MTKSSDESDVNWSLVSACKYLYQQLRYQDIGELRYQINDNLQLVIFCEAIDEEKDVKFEPDFDLN